MTEQEAQRIIMEHRTTNPQKIHGQRLYVLNSKLQAAGHPHCVEVYRLTKSGKSAILDHMDTLEDAARYAHPDVRAWLESRS